MNEMVLFVTNVSASHNALKKVNIVIFVTEGYSQSSHSNWITKASPNSTTLDPISFLFCFFVAVFVFLSVTQLCQTSLYISNVKKYLFYFFLLFYKSGT